jgi:hypothetical protein
LADHVVGGGNDEDCGRQNNWLANISRVAGRQHQMAQHGVPVPSGVRP